MDVLLHLIAQHGLPLVFAIVLVAQLGVPLPAYPLMMLAAATLPRGGATVSTGSLAALLATAVAASLVADVVWYLIGRRHGRRVLGLLCRISLSPDGCVRQTENVYARWGAPSLMVAKFIPGFASVATALAGAMRIRPTPFLAFDAIGAALWAGGALALGVLCAPAIDDIVALLARLGRWGVLLLAIALALFVGAKAWQRWRFNRQLRMARVSVDALGALLEGGAPLLLVDVRSTVSREEGRIPGAIALVSDSGLPDRDVPALARHPREATIVVYCACPNDASAVVAARRLLERGWRDVRPLAGGYDAWVASGRAIVRD